VNHLVQTDLIRIHQIEMRQAADHHRLVVAARRAARQRRPGRENLLDRLTRRAPRAIRGVAEAEPCPS